MERTCTSVRLKGNFLHCVSDAFLYLHVFTVVGDKKKEKVNHQEIIIQIPGKTN